MAPLCLIVMLFSWHFSAEDLTEKKHKTYRFPMIAGTWAGGGEMQLLGKFLCRFMFVFKIFSPLF